MMIKLLRLAYVSKTIEMQRDKANAGKVVQNSADRMVSIRRFRSFRTNKTIILLLY